MKNKIKDSIEYIERSLLITFFSNMLSPLHIAAHIMSIEDLEREKKLLKLSKKMLKIVNRFKELEYDNIKLFYEVYNKKENLSVKELQTLRDFCYALEDKYDLTIKKSPDEEKEYDIYYKYSEELDKFLEEKKTLNNSLK